MGKSPQDVATSPGSTDSHIGFLGRLALMSQSHAIKDLCITEKRSVGGTWEAVERGEVTWFLARRLNLPSLTERCRLHNIYVVGAIKN